MSVSRSLVLCLIFVAGCGEPSTYPVRGRVVFPDGAPLTTGGVVLFQPGAGEGRTAGARGAIGEDGAFELTTSSPGDGAVPGTHRVLVRAQRDADDYIVRGIIPRPVIDPRFESYETSRLEFTVERGQNEFTIVVHRPPQKR